MIILTQELKTAVVKNMPQNTPGQQLTHLKYRSPFTFMFRFNMALRSAVTRLLTTSQRSVAVAASRAQGTAAAASRGAFKTRRLTI